MVELTFYGKLILTGVLRARTGLLIGASQGGMEIGGVDKYVVKDARGRPFVPGSSLKGKLRSLSERLENRRLSSKGEVRIHTCESPDEFSTCYTCHLFGLPGEREFAEPARLIVRDAPLLEDSITPQMRDFMDLPYTEIKWENVLDRVTSAAVPRQFERVPAGAEFALEMVFSCYEEKDLDYLRRLFSLMKLLEDDALGASGSRGYGKVEFRDLILRWNSSASYMNAEGKSRPLNDGPLPLSEVLEQLDQLLQPIEQDITGRTN